MRLSSLSYYADYYLSLALVMGLAGSTLAAGTWIECAEWLLSACLGVAAWTLIEYLIHRFMYHHVRFFRSFHDAHHAEPTAHIGAPPVIGIVLILAVCFLPIAATRFVFASGLTSGMLIGYIAYMLAHHAAHFWQLSTGSWLNRLGRHHLLHHYQSKECNFGITTSFWDKVFGTAFPVSRPSLRQRSAGP